MSRPIRILFDAHPLLGQKTGIGYYTSQLITHMAAKYPNEVEFIGYYHNFLYRKPPVAGPLAPNISYRQIGFLPGQMVNLLRRMHLAPPIELLTFCKPDFILYPNYLGLRSLFRIPFAPVIHDLTFIDHPESMSDKNRSDLTAYVPKIVHQASFVITVSNFGRERINQELKVPDEKIVVTHIPPAEPLQIPLSKRRQLLGDKGITSQFILFIGTVEPRKNILRLIEAYSQLSPKVREVYCLVIAGKIDWKYAETKRKIEELQSQGLNIIYLGYVTDDLRASLYQEAALFVFPPFYEGFGMPILEALSYDTACAISNIPVFHEVAGQAAAYFDPYDPSDIARTMARELSTKPSVTKNARKKQLEKYEWDVVCANVYERIRKVV